MMIRHGTKRFGPPDAALAAIEDIHDIDRRNQIVDRMLNPDIRDWDSFLGLA